MTEERFAFLVAELEPADVPRIAYRTADHTLVQVWHFEAPAEITLRFRGRLTPPALLEITEVSPRPPVRAETLLSAEGTTLGLAASALPAGARITIDAAGADSAGWRLEDGGAAITLAVRRAVELEVAATLEGGPRADSPASPRAGSAPSAVRRSAPLWPDDARVFAPTRHRDALARIADGALRYVTGCALLRVAPGEACLLTDHRLLPLSWTRDAYYQALLLLAAAGPGHPEIVADHLRWLFGRCRREGGVWQRSHLANGEPKDLAYQADQQLFPVLELLDFHQATGSWPALPGTGTEVPVAAWGRLVDAVWRALPIAPSGLVRTDENPADDPSSLPHSLSVQILAWYVVRRLAGVASELGLDGAGLSDTAETIRDATERELTAPGPHGAQWAYEADGRGATRLYADANDVPTALAPAWGFCSAEDPVWRATMRFAFDEANPAYRPGPWGGLGSLHTPGTWPLGDAQEWLFAGATGDRERAGRALDRLTGVASSDGLLPEAYDPRTGAWTARHWFAWPAALVGALAFSALGR
jgi:hypothetical protein